MDDRQIIRTLAQLGLLLLGFTAQALPVENAAQPTPTSILALSVKMADRLAAVKPL